jgi:hypothetical protein
MQACFRLGAVLFLCAGLGGPAAASLGEIVRIEEGVAVIRHYALSELAPGSVVTVKRVLGNGEAWARGVVVSTERSACTVQIRLEGPRRGPALSADDHVSVTALIPSTSVQGTPALPGAGSRSLAPGIALPSRPREPSLRLPTMMFPLGNLLPKRR